MSETLYPHQAILSYLDKNCYRLGSAIMFILCGLYIGDGTKYRLWMGMIVGILAWISESLYIRSTN